jgi:hypothetical protein
MGDQQVEDSPRTPQDADVLVHVVVEEGREIGWGSNLAERLEDRAEDIRRGVESAARMVTNSIKTLPHPEGWTLGEVSAAFGVTLTAEAGVLVSKAGAGATFDVTLTFVRKE